MIKIKIDLSKNKYCDPHLLRLRLGLTFPKIQIYIDFSKDQVWDWDLIGFELIS